jgi:hypothetical protein
LQEFAKDINIFRSTVQDYITMQIEVLNMNNLCIHHIFYIMTIVNENYYNIFSPEIYMSYASFQERYKIIKNISIPALSVTIDRTRNFCRMIDKLFTDKNKYLVLDMSVLSCIDLLVFIHLTDNFN